MVEQRKTILIMAVVILVLFLFGVFTFSFILPPAPPIPVRNSTLPPETESNSILNHTLLNTSEPKESFTGAIIVGITRPVTILGAEGFSSSNISIKVGDSITWKNEDPRQKLIVLTFQRGREKNQFFSSPALWPEEEWEHTFWEEGEYNYWTTQYGVEGKVTVTPCRNRFCPRKD